MPEINRRVVVHWLAVITVKTVIPPEPPAAAKDPGPGERPCPR